MMIENCFRYKSKNKNQTIKKYNYFQPKDSKSLIIHFFVKKIITILKKSNLNQNIQKSFKIKLNKKCKRKQLLLKLYKKAKPLLKKNDSFVPKFFQTTLSCFKE